MSGRVIFVSVAVLSIAMIVGVGIWSSQAEYVPLATNLSPSEAAELKSKLDAEGITNQLNYSGSAVLVSKNDYSKARLVSGDTNNLWGDDPVDESSFFPDAPGAALRNKTRLEQSLSRSITALAAVSQCRVHISMAEPTPFVREKKPTKASVVVKLSNRAADDPTASIVAIVTGGAHGLEAENLTITNHMGVVMYSGSSSIRNELTRQLAFRRNIETDLAAHAERMLTHALGEGKVFVRVTADLDFTVLQRVETIYDTENKAKTYEKVETTDSTDAPKAAGGTGGTSENLNPTDTTNLLVKGGSSTKETIETKYELANTIDRLERFGGEIKRLTIAAMIDTEAVASSGETVSNEVIEDIIKNAVGFDETRSDSIKVMATKLKTPEVVEEAPAGWFDDTQTIIDLAKSASLGVAAVISLTVLMLIIRRLQPVGGSIDEDVEATAARARMVAEIAAHAKANPEAVKAIVTAWWNAEQEEQAADEETTSQAA